MLDTMSGYNAVTHSSNFPDLSVARILRNTWAPSAIFKQGLPPVLWQCWLGGRKGIQPVKNWVVGCWHGHLSGARCRLAHGPADATATYCLMLQWNPDRFSFLVLAQPGSPGQRADKHVCVCALLWHHLSFISSNVMPSNAINSLTFNHSLPLWLPILPLTLPLLLPRYHQCHYHITKTTIPSTNFLCGFCLAGILPTFIIA